MTEKYDKRWFFLTEKGNLGIRYNNEFGRLIEKVFKNKEELSEFIVNSSVSDRIFKFYKELQEVVNFLNVRI